MLTLHEEDLDQKEKDVERRKKEIKRKKERGEISKEEGKKEMQILNEEGRKINDERNERKKEYGSYKNIDYFLEKNPEFRDNWKLYLKENEIKKNRRKEKGCFMHV